MMNDFQPRINMLSPKAGDTIVVHIDADRLTIEQRKSIRAAVQPLLPAGVKVMVVDRGVTLTHISAGDIEVEQAPVPFHFDTWLRDCTERAHREFMARTSRLPAGRDLRPSIEQIARYMGAPV